MGHPPGRAWSAAPFRACERALPQGGEDGHMPARPLHSALILPLAAACAAAACARNDAQPSRAPLERIVPDATVPLDQFGTFTPSVSLGCRFVSVTSNHRVYVHDREGGGFVLASATPSGDPATHSSHGGLLPGGGRLSEDGGRVAFTSMADNLLPDDRPLMDQVYVKDLGSGRLWRASQSSAGEAGNAASRFVRLSGDGRVVAFVSSATNLVAGDTNECEDVFLHDLRTRETLRVSVGPAGEEADGGSRSPSLGRGGRWVAFASDATNLVAGDRNGVSDVFLHDSATGHTERISRAADGGEAAAASDAPALSATGRFVAFSSESEDLVPGDGNGARDVFLHDRATGRTVRVSVGEQGVEGDGPSDNAVVSSDGTRVAFVSSATNLVPGDSNGWPDVFLRDLGRGVTTRLSVGPGDAEADEESGAFGVALSPDGSCAAFESYATNLVPEDGDGMVDVFVRRLR
jgi:TolB protein